MIDRKEVERVSSVLEKWHSNWKWSELKEAAALLRSLLAEWAALKIYENMAKEYGLSIFEDIAKLKAERDEAIRHATELAFSGSRTIRDKWDYSGGVAACAGRLPRMDEVEGGEMSRHRVATVPGVTKRLIEELEKIVKPRQKSVKAVRERFGFTKATKTECSRQEEAGMSDHGLDRDGWPSADTVLESTRRELSAAQAEIERLRDVVAGGHCIRGEDGKSPCERLREFAKKLWLDLEGDTQHFDAAIDKVGKP